MAVSLKTDLRFPESGQHGHGSRIIQYLKLIKNFGNDNNEDIENEMKSVLINIQEIDKEHMPFKTMLFYCCFRLNKDFAWMLFKKFHLS